MNKDNEFNRRDFLKASGAFVGGIALSRFIGVDAHAQSVEKLGLAEGQYFKPAGTSILLVPIRKDWTFDNFGPKSRNPVNLTLTGGLLQARNVKAVQINGVDMTVGEIPFVGGNFKGNKDISGNADQYLALAVLQAGGKTYFEQTSAANGEVLSGFTGIWEEGVYPAKMWNTMEACKNLLAYQEQNDGFSTSSHFSFSKIQKDIYGDRNFKAGFNILGDEVRGGGIDAAVAVLTRSIYPLTQTGAASYINLQSNPDYFQYFTGPSSPEITDIRTDQMFDIIAGGPKGDFEWSFKDKLYLNISASIIPNTENWSGEAWLAYPADAKLVLTMTWSKRKPEVGQAQKLQSLMDTYAKYHKEGPTSAAAQELLKLGHEQVVDWGEAQILTNAVHPELKIDNFKAELGGSEKGSALYNIADFLLQMKKSGKKVADFAPADVLKFYYGLVFYFQDLVKDYTAQDSFTLQDQMQGKYRPSTKLGDFIADRMNKDGILSSVKNISGGLDKSLRYLNYNTYLVGDQALQCLGWVANLGELGLPVSPTPIWDISTNSASGILQPEARRALKNQNSVLDVGYEGVVFYKVNDVKDAEVGDSFIRYGGGNNHIGTVIGKKQVNGETVLLITDANRKNDGQIRVFEVDKNNFRIIFGDPESPLFPVVIRNSKVETFLGGK